MVEDTKKKREFKKLEITEYKRSGLTIGKKLISVFLLMSLIPIAIVGYLSFYSASTALKKQALAGLEAIVNSRVSDITHLIQLRQEQVKELAGTFLPRQLESSGVNDPENIAKIQAHIESILAEMKLQPKSGYNNIDKVTAIEIIGIWDTEGTIIANTDKELIGRKMPDKFLQGAKSRGAFFGGFLKDPLTQKYFLIFTQAIRDYEDEKFAGVALFKVDAQILNEIAGSQEGLGKTGETLLGQKVGDKAEFITRLRHTDDPPVITLGSDLALPIQGAVQGKNGKGISIDYRSKEVITIWKHIPSVGWGIVGKIDTAEAFAPARSLGLRILWIFSIISIIVVFSAYFMAKSISKPIESLSGMVVKVGNGDLSVDIASNNRSDEVGILTMAFARMVESLREQIRNILEGINVIASSASEITATSSQLSASAEETAVSVAETTTTVEEVRQTAEQASEKATQISESVEGALDVSKAGEKAVKETIEGMNRINEQMSSISESIVILSGQSQAIGEIIVSVDNLAEQSNLLAVNASIEAAKAGDEGKGFSVVAQEIKNLSEQSKESTSQVRTILNDIQKAVSNVGMATELGNKVVDSGVKQSDEAAKSIKEMAHIIEEFADAARQIAVSSNQQKVGVTQASTAMESIKQASGQNLEGSKQLVDGARNLDELGQRLRQLVERYNV